MTSSLSSSSSLWSHGSGNSIISILPHHINSMLPQHRFNAPSPSSSQCPIPIIDSDIQSALGKVLSEVSYEEDALARYIFNVVCVPGGKISQQVADKITASLQKPLPIKLCDGNTCLCLQSGTASKGGGRGGGDGLGCVVDAYVKHGCV